MGVDVYHCADYRFGDFDCCYEEVMLGVGGFIVVRF
jgi:hypothetical protein